MQLQVSPSTAAADAGGGGAIARRGAKLVSYSTDAAACDVTNLGRYWRDGMARAGVTDWDVPGPNLQIFVK